MTHQQYEPQLLDLIFSKDGDTMSALNVTKELGHLVRAGGVINMPI